LLLEDGVWVVVGGVVVGGGSLKGGEHPEAGVVSTVSSPADPIAKSDEPSALSARPCDGTSRLQVAVNVAEGDPRGYVRRIDSRPVRVAVASSPDPETATAVGYALPG
jgi:hypothetical protein